MATEMTNRPQDPETGAGSAATYDRESTTGMPRWVKVGGLVLALAVLLFIVMLLVGGVGRHGPARHASSSDGGATATVVSGT